MLALSACLHANKAPHRSTCTSAKAPSIDRMPRTGGER
ncbi:hypothetical protein PATSB16_13860 [Pandoraea thiooxydans]|nr:hypothetical protein PATSB16_13860 [Pandoraea thiooxydans]